MIFENQSNNKTGNIFETLVGAINVAPTKISGKYKIVVGLDGVLYLDDYTGRRVVLNTELEFLPQVANFLQVNTLLSESEKESLQYGAFQRLNKKYYHIPFYIGHNTYPKYFVLSRAVNEQIENLENLFIYSRLHQVIDLEKIGLYKIFDEVNNNKHYDFPLYFNWENNFVNLYGYSLDKDVEYIHKHDLTLNQSNQPYLDVLNNQILNLYGNKGIIFPRFINIEFEFEYSTEIGLPFNNFFGFLGNGETITEIPEDPNEIDYTQFKMKLKEYPNKIEWTQQMKNTPVEFDTYEVSIGDGSLQEINEQIPQIRYYTKQLSVNDIFKIIHPNGDTIFEYLIKPEDIVNTSLYQSLINITKNATKESGRQFLFSTYESETKSGCFVTIKANTYDSLTEDYIIEVPQYFKTKDRFEGYDNYNKFRGITKNDCWLYGQPYLFDNTSQFNIDNDLYNITDKFLFNNRLIIRVDQILSIDRITSCDIIETKPEKLVSLIPIPFLNYNSPLKNELTYDQEIFSNELKEKFLDIIDPESQVLSDQDKITAITNALTGFNSRNEPAIDQYVKEGDNGQLEDTNKIDIPNHNVENVLNLMFASMGHTAYLTPNILNIDKQFYTNNGNLNPNELSSDVLRFNWFLIKSECPDYLKNDIRSLRFFTDKPKLTSRVLKVSDNSCETIFLGVKYKLPTKYEDYQFAVIVDGNNRLYTNLGYYFEVHHSERVMYLYVSKYMDFVDLLRGGDINNPPFLDLSFFYNNISSHNTLSDDIDTFKNGGVKLGIDFKPGEYLLYDNVEVHDWKYQPIPSEPDNWVIALRREDILLGSNISDLRLIFPESGDHTLYVYSSIKDGDIEYSYVSMTIDVIGIQLIQAEHLWCKDVRVKFFDTQQIFLQKYNIDGTSELLYVDKDNIVSYEDKSLNTYGDSIQTIMIDGQQNKFQIINPNKIFSIREDYFEVVYRTIPGKSFSREIFRFPECTLTEQQIIDTYAYDDHITIYEYTKISLFDRNQIWRVIQDSIRTSLKFKELFESQVRKILNEFMVNSLIDYSDLNAVEIKNSNALEYINMKVIDVDKNIAIWNLFDEKRISAMNRLTSAYLPYFQIHKNLFDFQLQKNHKPDRLFNIYDNDFGGEGITATGLWKEVQGNIVSSLYCRSANIEITLDKQDTVNFKDLLIDRISIADCIVNNYNDDYIKKINKNIVEYIKEKYVEYILDNFYYFDSVINEFGKRIKYNNDNKNENVIHFNIEYIDNFDYLTFVFKRK